MVLRIPPRNGRERDWGRKIMKEIYDALARARLDRPYFGRAFAALSPVEVNGLGTVAVDKHWRLYYDPATIKTWGLVGTAAAMVHEIAHLLRRHHMRAEA